MRTTWAAGHRVVLFACLLLPLCNARWVKAEAGLIAHWTFDEGSGTTAGDSSGNGNTGTLVNGPVWTTGIIGGGVSFDGANDLVTVPDNLIKNNLTLTLAMWFQTTAPGVMFGYQDAAYPNGTTNFVPVLYVGTDGKLRGEFWMGADLPITSALSVSDGRWHNVALTGNTNTQTLYLDGQLVGTLAGQINHLNMSKNQVGTGRGGWPGIGSGWQCFGGNTDDVRIYSRALSQAEIQALIPQGPPQVRNDSYAVQKDTPLTVNAAQGVLANDYDVNGDTFTAIKQTDPAHGSVTLNANGSFTYTPNGGYQGVDTFTYKANDGTGDSNVATVTITVTQLSAGLLAWWKFDEGAGTTCADSSGNGHTGTLVNGPAWTTGIIGGGVSFDGSNDLVTVPDNLVKDHLALTVAMWFRTTASGAMFGHQNEAYPADCPTYIPILYVGSDGKLRGEFSVNAVSPITSASTVNDNRWHHVALSGNVNTQTMYLDGQPVGTLAGTIDHANMSKNQLGMGRSGGWWPGLGGGWAPFRGNLDDARIYSRALTQAEIQALLPQLPPQAVDDSYIAQKDTPLTVNAAQGVLANDYDVDLDTFSAIKQAGPAHGSVTLNADGSFTYTPNSGFTGMDTFTYVANDGANSAPGTVRINVGGMIGWWKFDEGSGTTAGDSSGNGNTGTLVNGPAWTSGLLGAGALHFDGADDHVRVPQATSLEPKNAVTVCLWANITDTRAGSTSELVRKTGSYQYGWLLRWSNQDGRLQWRIDRSANPGIFVLDTQSNSAYLNRWHHYAATYDQTTCIAALYVDGVLRNSVSGATGPLENMDDLYMMWYTDGAVATPGDIDDVRIYARALSQGEIQALIPQRPPVAVDASYWGRAGKPLVVTAPGVLANDYDINGDSFTAVKQTDPAHGSVTLNAAGSFTYTPNGGFTGTDSFTYTANDGANSAPATVTINVGPVPLPAGNIKRMLHLGANEADRITGYPTSGQGILWDFFTYAGLGPEHLQQPSPGQAVDMRLAVASATSNTVLVWTDLIDNDGVWAGGLGDNYDMYWAIYIWAPSNRSAKVVSNSDDEARIWMDGNQTPLLSTASAGTFSNSFTLTSGYHSFIFKLHEGTGNDYFSVKFTNPDNSDMTDLQYTLADPIQPTVAGVLPANAATGAPAWSDYVITFSEPMDTSVDPATVAAVSGGAASGTWSWADNTTLMWMPSSALAVNTAYTVTLTAANAKDRTGNALSGGNAFTFTTTSTLSSPSLAAISPNKGNAGVVRASLNGAGFIEGGVRHPADAVPFQGHYYSYKNQKTDWYNACSLAAAQGGHLVTLANAQEDDFVWHLGGMTNNWIGLTDSAVEGTFVWYTGETDTYRNWGPGLPDEWGGEDWGIYWWGFQWNDVETGPTSLRPYVMEFDSKNPPAVKLARAGHSDISATNVHYTDSGHLEFDLSPAGAADGAWDVVLTNPDGATATLPSGFTLDGTPPHVLGVTPRPGDVLPDAPAAIVVTVDEALAPASVTATTCRLVRAGPDGLLDTADDVAITPVAVILETPTRIKLDLTGLTLPDDHYRVTIGSCDVSASLEAYWRLNENAGATTADSSGKGHNGTLNGPVWTPGKIGAGLFFDTNTATVDINADDIGPPWTVALWVKRKDSPNVCSNVLFSNSAAIRLEQAYGTKKVGFTAFGVADWTFNYEAPIGSWVHLTFVGTSSTTSLYANGTLQDTIAVSISAPMEWIGCASGDSLKGTLDDVRVYSRALAESEIAAIANGQISDLAGNALDGEYSGSWPSGNGMAGGDFVSTFTITQQLSVASLTPTPNTIAYPPASVEATFSRDLDASTVNANTFLLVGRGPDGVFDTADDVPITAAAITIVGTKQAKFDLGGITLNPDVYRVKLISGGIKDSLGNALDGEFSGVFPSGDNTAGGDFVATFKCEHTTITSPATAAGNVGYSFSYQITATNSPFSYNAIPLPAGLSVDTNTGAITGTPTTVGTTSVTISATNVGGTGAATLTITINPALTITTLAGLAGAGGSADGTGSAARFDWPQGVAVDGSGNVYVADMFNNTIRKITAGGVVSTLAGSAGGSGSADGTGTAAQFYQPSGVAVDGLGNVYVADTWNHIIRKITPGGVVSTLAGLAGNAGSADGTGSAARFFGPTGVAVDGSGNVYVADNDTCIIRKITPAGVVSTLAGLAQSGGSADGTGSVARFWYPQGVAVDGSGNVYVADTFNSTIRKITAAGLVSTLAGSAANPPGRDDGTGSAARFSRPYGVAVDSSGEVYVADTFNHTIRKITPAGLVSTLAGLAGTFGSADGTGNAARFYYPSSVAVDGSGIVYVADTFNYTIRKSVLSTKVQTETAADGSGTVVPAQTVNAGSSITVYAITRDASNNFGANVAATWSLLSKTGGVVDGDLVVSGDTKSATFTGHVIGTAVIDAASGGLDKTDSGTITVVPGPASALLVSGFSSPTTSGVAGNVTVTAQDAYGNTATGYTGAVQFSSSDGQAVLPADYTFVAGDNGTHSFSVTLRNAGTQSITATDTGTSSISGTQSGITVSPRAITVTAATDNKTYDGTTSSSGVPAITAGSLAPGDSAAWTQTFDTKDVGTGKTLTPSGSVSDGNGGNNYSVTFVSITTGVITPGPASMLVVSGFPSPAAIGAAGNVTVAAQDKFGNTATSYTGKVKLTSTDLAATLPADYTFQAADNRVHTFSVTLNTAGTQSITVTDTATPTIMGTQSGIIVQGGTVATPTFSQAGATYTSVQAIAISCATSGATIFYTTDGSTPTTASAQYSAAISLSTSGTITIKAYAVKADFTDSGVAIATYTILVGNSGGNGAPTPNAGAAAANPVGGVSVQVIYADAGVVQLEVDLNGGVLPPGYTATTTFYDGSGKVLATIQGSRPIFMFTDPGMYLAMVTVTDAQGNVVGETELALPISAAETGTAQGTILPSNLGITAASLKGKLLFNAAKADTVSFKGTIELPAGLDLSKPQKLSVSLGNVVDTASLDAKGKAKSGANNLLKNVAVKYPKLKKPATTTRAGQKATVSLTLSAPQLDLLGFDCTGVSKVGGIAGQSVQRTIGVALLLGGTAYRMDIPVDWRLSKKGDSGQVTGKK